MSDKDLAEKLIYAFPEKSATEELISFVAGEKGMLDFCSRLVAQQGVTEDIHEFLRKEAEKKRVSIQTVYQEIRKVTGAFNADSQELQQSFSLLHLPVGSSRADVKRAYRKLCTQYHPDSRSGDTSATDKFIELTRAYNTILAADESGPVTGERWRYKSRVESQQKQRSSPDKKKNLGVISGVVGVLMLIALAAPFFYQKTLIDTSAREIIPVDDEPPTPEAENSILAVQSESAALHTVSKSESKAIVKQPEKEEVPAAIDEEPEEYAQFDWQNDPEYAEGLPQWLLDRGKKHVVSKQKKIEKEESSVVNPVQTDTTFPEEEQHIPELGIDNVKTSHEYLEVKEQQKENFSAKTLQVAAAGEGEQEKEGNLNQQMHSQASSRGSEESKTRLLSAATQEFPGKNVKEPDLREQLDALLTTYTTAYESRELSRFFAMFVDDATENNVPIREMRQKYIELFRNTSSINFAVEEYSYSGNENPITVNGIFDAKIFYNSGKGYLLRGNIKLGVIRERDELKVASLDYVFSTIDEFQQVTHSKN